MSEGLLLDTNALVLVRGRRASQAGRSARNCQGSGVVAAFCVGISAWEAALALQKPNPARRPNLGGLDAAAWFASVRRTSGARVINISSGIAIEAARVASQLRIGDPGDCHIIATARHRDLLVLTRDAAMLALARRDPQALRALAC